MGRVQHIRPMVSPFCIAVLTICALSAMACAFSTSAPIAGPITCAWRRQDSSHSDSITGCNDVAIF